MIDQEYIDLMNQELDGVNTASQSRKLEEYCAAHPAAREYFAEIQDAVQIFQKVPLIDPPAGLLDSVMASVRSAASPMPRSTRSEPAARRSWFQPARALTFATGALFGLILFAGIARFDPRGPDTDAAWIQGTASGFLESNRPWVDTRAIDLPGVSGVLRSLGRREGTLVHLKLAADGPVRISFRHGDRIVFEGYRAAPGNVHTVAADTRGVVIEHRGDGDYHLLFAHPRDLAAAIDVRLQTEGGSRIDLAVPTAR